MMYDHPSTAGSPMSPRVVSGLATKAKPPILGRTRFIPASRCTPELSIFCTSTIRFSCFSTFGVLRNESLGAYRAVHSSRSVIAEDTAWWYVGQIKHPPRIKPSLTASLHSITKNHTYQMRLPPYLTHLNDAEWGAMSVCDDLSYSLILKLRATSSLPSISCNHGSIMIRS